MATSLNATGTYSNAKLEALAKILAQERDKGWLDTTVMGGLDKFLARWTGELNAVLGDPPSYADLSPDDRSKWANAAMKKMGLAPPVTPLTPALPGNPTKNRKPASRRRRPIAEPGLDDDIMALRSVTKRNVARLNRLGMETISDLILHFPHRHNDFARLRKVADIVPGDEQTVMASRNENLPRPYWATRPAISGRSGSTSHTWRKHWPPAHRSSSAGVPKYHGAKSCSSRPSTNS